MENKVIAFTGVKELAIMDHGIPELGPNDVLVHVKATAICTQEQRFYTGDKKVNNYPAVGGHESSGDVIAVGKAVKNCKVGDKVACDGGVVPASGRKRFGGEQSKTPDGDGFYKIIAGTLSKYVVRNEEDVIVCDPGSDYANIALVEPASCVLSSINKADIQIADTVVVIGAGIMGLLHVQFAKLRGAIVIVSEVDPVRLEKAKAVGADYVVNPKEQDIVEEIKGLTGGKGAEIVFNTTALPSNWDPAIKMLNKRGKLICYSSQHPDEPIPLSMGMVHSTQIQIIGTVSSSPYEKFICAKLLSKKMLKVDEVIDSYYPFENAKEAFEKSIVPGTYRVMITD